MKFNSFLFKYILVFCNFFYAEQNKLVAKINCTSAKSNFTLFGAGAKLILSKPIDSFSGILKVPEMEAGSITQTSTENKFNFSKNSTMLLNGNQSSLVGDIDFYNFAGGEIILDGNKTLFVNGGEFNQKILVSGTGNLILGSPMFNQDIILADSNTELQLALTSKLTSDIILNGGTIKMLGDLSLKDDILIIGPGTIDVNNYTLSYPNYQERKMQGDITFVNGNAIVINIRTTLSSNWNFTGTYNHLQGTGVIVDMVSGGGISIADGTTLFCNGIHFKGVGNPGYISFSGSNAKLLLTTTILELAGTTYQNNGELVIEGSDCKIIAGAGQSYLLNNAASIFTVNGQVLWYESRDKLSEYPLGIAYGGTIRFFSGGKACSNFPVGGGFGLIVLYNSNYSTDININFTGRDIIYFANATQGTPKSMTLDGLNNTINLGSSSSQPIILEPNVNLLIKNITIDNFDLAKFLFAGSGATLARLTFGDNVFLNMDKNVTLNSPLNFLGNSTLDCNGEILTLSSNGINLTGNNKTLTIKHGHLKLNNYNSIKVLSSLAKIQMEDVDLYLTNTGYTFDTGILEFKNFVNFHSFNSTTASGTSQFSLTTTGSATILADSEVSFEEDMVFLYEPNVSGDAGNSYLQKRHLKTSSPSSTLRFKNATLNTGTNGLAIDYGKLLIEESSFLITSATAGKEFELGSAVNAKVYSGNIFDVSGNIKYITTTYP